MQQRNTIISAKITCYKETAESKRAHGHEAWDPDWIRYVFTAWAICGHPSCRQEVAISGIGGVEPQLDPEEGMGWGPYFAPQFCSPMPDVFELPVKCPDEIKKELRAAFSLFWSDYSAAANRLRVAIECLMDHIGVRKRSKDKNGKFIEIPLHQRIELFTKGEPSIGSQFMALKWLGNTGSHEGQVSRDDVLDAFEIFEHALSELIDRRTKKVVALAKKLTKKHKKG